MNKLLRPALTALVCCAAIAAAAKTSVKLNDTLRTGFNAIDHVLQRPAGPRLWTDAADSAAATSPSRLFISGGAGVSMTGTDTRAGFRGEAALGGWFTPVHGWRVALTGGSHSVTSSQKRAFFGAVSADYLMNFSALLRGYDPDRRFELLGALGVDFQRMRQAGSWANEYGAHAALQARFYTGPSLFLYAEPRLTLLHGRAFGPDMTRRFRPDLSFSLGLGYRLLQGEARRRVSDSFRNVDDSHLFFSLGAGAAAFTRGMSGGTIGPAGRFAVGKWFSPVSAVRVHADFSRLPRKAAGRRRYISTVGADYVWNLGAAFGGYRNDDVFGLNLNLGAALAYGNRARGRVYPGAEAGLTASLRLSPNWSFFIEPQLQLFGRDFTRDMTGRSSLSPFAILSAGLTYTIGDFYTRFPRSFDDYLADKHYFLTLGGAPAHRFRGNYGTGFAGMIGFGRRFTPVSSWRITADGEIYRRSPGYASLSLAADYMFSMSTSMAGYNPGRVFDVSGVLGIFAGGNNYEQPLKAVIGGKAGLHGAFRLNDALSLFVEPQLLAVRAYGHRNTGWTPEGRVMVGLTYRLGAAKGGESYSGDDEGDGADGSRNFVSLAGGPATCSGAISSGRDMVHGAFSLQAGRWFSRVSGLRIAADYDFIPSDLSWRRLNMYSFHADYMLSISSLMDPTPGRRFHVVGTAGLGLGISDAQRAKAGLMGSASLRLVYNLPGRIDLHLEPGVAAYMNRVAPNYGSGTRFLAVGRVLAGASWRF